MTGTTLDAFGPDGQHWQIDPGTCARGFVEGRRYVFHIAATGPRLFIDDAPLLATGNRHEWQVGFYAGRVRAELIDTDERLLADYQLDVGPTPDKLGQPLFAAMLDDILANRPDWLLGSDAGRSLFASEAGDAAPEIQYARLLHHIDACLRALDIVCERPIAHLGEARRWADMRHLRRLDAHAATQLARSPLAGLLQRPPPRDLVVGNTAIEVPLRQLTLDNAANRTLAWTLKRLQQRVSQLVDWLQRAACSNDAVLAAKCPRRLTVLKGVQRRLQRLTQAQPFAAVTHATVSSTGLTAVSAQPAYARACHQAWLALRSGIGDRRATDTLPISPTWQVYERWCFLTVTQVLRSLYPDAIWVTRQFGHDRDQVCVSTTIAAHRIGVWSQLRFPAFDLQGNQDRRSLSRERRPDICITVDDAHASAFLVLDAKYRASRPNVLDAMQSAHTYRDSLLRHGERPRAAYLLVPRAAATPWLAETAFHGMYRTGIIELAAHGATDQISQVLQRFLQDTIGVAAPR